MTFIWPRRAWLRKRAKRLVRMSLREMRDNGFEPDRLDCTVQFVGRNAGLWGDGDATCDLKRVRIHKRVLERATSEQVFKLVHELGHIADCQLLDDSTRQRFVDAICSQHDSYPHRWRHTDSDEYDYGYWNRPSEVWANAFAQTLTRYNEWPGYSHKTTPEVEALVRELLGLS